MPRELVDEAIEVKELEATAAEFDAVDEAAEVDAVEAVEREIIINWPRAEQVLDRLMVAYDNNEFPYNQDSVRVPHDPRHMPETLERGTPEHAMFLFSTCYYMRGGIKSVDAFKRMSQIYDNHPELFVASVAAERSPDLISLVLHRYGLGYQHLQIGRFWVENARRLQEKWEGDPRKLFDGVSDYETCLERIHISRDKQDGFHSFRKKMVSMITYYLMDEGLIEPFVFPLPVDFHVGRISVAHELVLFPGYDEAGDVLSEEALDTMRTLYYEYALKRGVDPLRLCDAVWLLSEALCGKQPGNVTLEPQGRKNRKGRSTELVPSPVVLEDPKQQALYDRTCRACPVEETCVWNVPGKVYYVQGELRRRGRRVEIPAPPQSRLFRQETL